MKADVKPTTHAEKLVAAILALGVDRYMQPLSIKTKDLAKKTGIAAASIQACLDPAVKRGDVVVCKVTPATGHSYNEWRAGPGVPPTQFKPLNTKRSGVALRTPAYDPRPAVPLSTPKPGANEIEPALLGQPQSAVGKNTDSARSDSSLILPEARAVAAQATPKPKAGVRLKEEPATPEASAGDAPYLGALDISINHNGTLIIGTVESVIELAPEHTRRLGNFMLGSQGVWNPF